MIPPPGFIELHRRFRPARIGDDRENSALESYASASIWFRDRSSIRWPDVLKYPLVVVLGEPGSGKTWEMRNQTALRSACPFSFFIPLDELAAAGAELPLSADDHQLFREW